MSILVGSSDLMFRTQISETAKLAGQTAQTAQSATDFFEKIRQEKPRLIFLDLDSAPLAPMESLRTLKNSADLEGVTVVAFYQHTRKDLRIQAESLGCDHVLTRGQMVARLKDLLAKYA